MSAAGLGLVGWRLGEYHGCNGAVGGGGAGLWSRLGEFDFRLEDDLRSRERDRRLRAESRLERFGGADGEGPIGRR